MSNRLSLVAENFRGVGQIYELQIITIVILGFQFVIEVCLKNQNEKNAKIAINRNGSRRRVKKLVS